MDWTVIERMWTQAKGRIQTKWDKLTKDDLELIAGRRERLEAKIRHLYGFSPEHRAFRSRAVEIPLRIKVPILGSVQRGMKVVQDWRLGTNFMDELRIDWDLVICASTAVMPSPSS